MTKPKKCKNCGEPFEPQRPLQKICNYKCAIELSKKLQKVIDAKKWRGEKKVMKEKLKTASNWKQDLQVLINRIVRLIDYGQPCIATGSLNGKINAGHYFSVSSNDTIRFNLHNIHIQSEHSNSYKSGDTLNYQSGIERVYGIKYLEYMNSLKGLKPLHLCVPKIKVAIEKCKVIIKELEQKGYVYDAKTRVNLRNLYNEQIGIYK